MILKALYDYYHRNKDKLAPFGWEYKQIGFIIVLDKDGHFLRFEDRRIDSETATEFLVKREVDRSGAPVANYLYDKSEYVFGYSKEKKKDKNDVLKYFNTFKEKIKDIYARHSEHKDMKAVFAFYQQEPAEMLEAMQQAPLWPDIQKNLNKKYSLFTFLIEGETEIVASRKELIDLNDEAETEEHTCLITGKRTKTVRLTTRTPISGSADKAKLVAFQTNHGFDSYGKSQGNNAPISEEAEFAYTTALKHMLHYNSRNKFMIGNRTYLFWASSDSEAAKAAEESLFAFWGRTDSETDNPNERIDLVRRTFMAIYNGQLHANRDDRFYILGLAPNSARIAVVYWAELPLRDFSKRISRHFQDMEIVDTRKDKKPYMGLHSILGTVTQGGKSSKVTPNLPDAVVKSIFQGLPYPVALFQACLRRIRAEQTVNMVRAAIIKAYLNRLNDYSNNKKIEPMLDKENQNPGYLCGRLFAVLDKIQEEANRIGKDRPTRTTEQVSDKIQKDDYSTHTIRKRYINSASSTPTSVFATLLNLSTHHQEKLNTDRQVYFEKLKQEIISKMNADGFPSHLGLQDQGRFFVGYYHQRQDFFMGKDNKETEEIENQQE